MRGCWAAADLVLLCLSALLFGFSFPNYFFTQGVPFCAWGCALPLFYVLAGRPLRQRLMAGLIWGLLAHGLLMTGLFSVSVGGWFLLALALALQGIFFAAFYPPLVLHPFIKFLFLPSAWVVSEWIRSWILGGFVWGLGYSQGGVPLIIQPASWGGVYAVSWLVVAVNAAVYLGILSFCAQERRRGWFVLLVAVWVVTGTAVFGVIRLGTVSGTAGYGRVAVVQPNIASMDKPREDLYAVHAARHLALTEQVARTAHLGAKDVVVWPETSFPDDILTDNVWRPRLERAAQDLGVNLLVGSALLRGGKDYNSALLLSAGGQWPAVYDKQHLVPFCEFTPSGMGFMGIGRYHFEAGSRPGLMTLPVGRVFGLAICSEEFYPGLFRAMVRGGAGFAVVMLNDGWFARPEALFMHALAAPLRAVETGLPVVRAANTGRTCAFDGAGRLLDGEIKVQRLGVSAYELPVAEGRTFYAQYGDIFAMACALFVIIFLVQRKGRAVYAVG